MKVNGFLSGIVLSVVGFLLLSGFYQRGKNYAKAPVVLNKTELLRLVNEARRSGYRCGNEYYPPVKPLVWSGKLEAAAKNHANDMSRNNFFSHTSSNGASVVGRLKSVDYKWLSFGENIAMGYKSERDAVNAWLKSPSHCKNIMCGDFTEMGVATSGVYWTQVFGRPNQ